MPRNMVYELFTAAITSYLVPQRTVASIVIYFMCFDYSGVVISVTVNIDWCL